MKSKQIRDWLMNISNTQDEEISCTECFHWVSHYVEVELSGENPVTSMPKVRQHIDQCPACREEYETLRDLQRMENEGNSLSIDDFKNILH